MSAGRRAFLAGAAALAAFTPWPGWASGPREPVGYLRTNWSQDPWALGSYSFIPRGASRRDHAELAQPVDDRLYFAGEAAHPEYNSTVHAAHESGLRAAGECLAAGHRRVAVIGAGMAGLSAASRLAQAGLEVVVHEARDRIGGRILTDRNSGVPLDLGASWIHGAHGNPLVALAKRAAAPLAATENSYTIRGKDGREISDRDAPGWLFEVTEVQNSYGAAAERLGPAAYDDDTDYDGPDMLLPEGYSQVLDVLAGAYELRLSTPVSRITRDAAGAEVDGTHFDAAIVTLPLGVLKTRSVTFEPNLPKRKRAAIGRLGMGLLDKLYLGFDHVFWDRDVTWIMTPDTGLPRGQFNGWLNLAPYLDAPILLAFNGGPAARTLSGQTDEALVRAATRVLAHAYPG